MYTFRFYLFIHWVGGGGGNKWLHTYTVTEADPENFQARGKVENPKVAKNYL